MSLIQNILTKHKRDCDSIKDNSLFLEHDMRIVDLDVTTLEGQILYMLDKVATKNAQVSALTMELDKDKITLRNYLHIYKQTVTAPQVDDLIAAIIKDRLLQEDDIKLVFDMEGESWTQCIERINERNASKW